jgi:bacterioferritin-associated ferredoxin
MIFLVVVGLSGISHAETQLPRGSFEFADLEKAKAQAVKEKKEIAFLYTDKTSTCGLCQNAAAEFMDAVKSKAIIVYVNSKDRSRVWKQLPAAVRTALTPGRYIPKMAVTDASGEKVSASILYDDYKKDSRQVIRAFKKDLRGE